MGRRKRKLQAPKQGPKPPPSATHNTVAENGGYRLLNEIPNLRHRRHIHGSPKTEVTGPKQKQLLYKRNCMNQTNPYHPANRYESPLPVFLSPHPIGARTPLPAYFSFNEMGEIFNVPRLLLTVRIISLSLQPTVCMAGKAIIGPRTACLFLHTLPGRITSDILSGRSGFSLIGSHPVQPHLPTSRTT